MSKKEIKSNKFSVKNFIFNQVHRSARFHPLIIFAILLIVCFYKIILSGGIVGYQDAPYTWPNSSFNFWSTWISSFQGVSWAPNMFGTPITGYIPLILHNFGLSNSFISYIVYLLPLYLSIVIFFYIARDISKSSRVAYFIALFSFINTFNLEQIILLPGHYF